MEPASPTPEPQSLLDEIDARQNEILSELDRLNERIENLLQEALQSRQAWQGEEFRRKAA